MFIRILIPVIVPLDKKRCVSNIVAPKGDEQKGAGSNFTAFFHEENL